MTTLGDFIDPQETQPVPDEWLRERVRNWRNRRLASTDWTQLTDAPSNSVQWAEYRQALRDLPLDGDLQDVVFPEPPE